MKNLRSLLFGIIYFVVAGLIGYGLEKLLVAILPSDAAGIFTRVYDIGLNTLSFNFNLCGVIGLVAAYFIVGYLVKK